MYELFRMINVVFNDINGFKDYINSGCCEDFAIDMSNRNIFESLKFIVLSSAYYYQKHPENKLKCVVDSEDIKTLASSLEIKNLEFV